MICLGILTVRQEKPGIWQKLKTPVSLKEDFTTQVQVKVAELGWSKEELRHLPKWIRRWLYRYGIRFLKRQGCVAVAPEEQCAEAFGVQNGEFQGIHKGIPDDMLWKCMAFLLDMNSSAIPRHAYIKRNVLAMPDYRILKNLCARIDTLTFCTGDEEGYVITAEQVCTEYGIYPDIHPAIGGVFDDGILIDMDENMVRIDQERMADGVELTIDLHGHRVNQEMFFKDLPLPFERLTFGSWTKGKKRLTRW